MTFGETHPVEHLEGSVAELRRRARLAVAALVATALVRAVDAAARGWSIGRVRAFERSELDLSALEAADTVVNATAVGINVLLVVTAALFLRWVHRLVALTRSLGGSSVGVTPAEAAWAFVIPIVSLYRPFQVMRATRDALEPEAFENPPPRVDADAAAHYRDAAIAVPPPPPALPQATLGAWWGSFVLMNITGRFAQGNPTDLSGVVSTYQVACAVDALALVAAGFAVTVVRALTARLDERFRRLRFATPEALARQGFVGVP